MLFDSFNCGRYLLYLLFITFRKIALNMLRSQLWELQEEKRITELKDRRSQVGRNMRAEKIRTYNYPQNRVTDHRIGKSWHQLDRIIDGDLDGVLADVAAGLDLA